MKFFESDIIQEELKKMQELYVDINRMGIILTVDEKIKQLEHELLVNLALCDFGIHIV